MKRLQLDQRLVEFAACLLITCLLLMAGVLGAEIWEALRGLL